MSPIIGGPSTIPSAPAQKVGAQHATLHLDASNFDKEVLQAKGPVLVDFFATWCPPCRLMGPKVDSLADELKDTMKVAKVDIDKSPDLASKYGIQSIPAFVVFDKGKVVATKVGGMSYDQLAAYVKPYHD